LGRLCWFGNVYSVGLKSRWIICVRRTKCVKMYGTKPLLKGEAVGVTEEEVLPRVGRRPAREGIYSHSRIRAKNVENDMHHR